MSTQRSSCNVIAEYRLKTCKSICSNIKCCKSCSSWLKLVHGENDLTSHTLGSNFNGGWIGK